MLQLESHTLPLKHERALAGKLLMTSPSVTGSLWVQVQTALTAYIILVRDYYQETDAQLSKSQLFFLSDTITIAASYGRFEPKIILMRDYFFIGADLASSFQL